MNNLREHFIHLISGFAFLLVFCSCSSTGTNTSTPEMAMPIAPEIVSNFTPPELPLKKITNSLGMDFLFIPPGEFVLGSPLNESDRRPDEKQHLVKFQEGYYIQTTEVTQGQWNKITGNTPSYFKECGENCPVEAISWDEIQSFIAQLNKIEGHDKYRLPTEAEWEYACRAGTTTPFSYGKCISTDQANYNDLEEYKQYEDCPSTGVRRKTTIPVASLEPNPWGLYDMNGNVWEWCQDWYGDYPDEIAIDPTGPVSGQKRVYRGASQNDRPSYCRSSFRAQFKSDRKSGSLGFRLAMTP